MRIVAHLMCVENKPLMIIKNACPVGIVGTIAKKTATVAVEHVTV